MQLVLSKETAFFAWQKQGQGLNVLTAPSGNPSRIGACLVVMEPATAGEADVECATAFRGTFLHHGPTRPSSASRHLSSIGG
ncbi:hypothetical protein SynRS9902_01444 [Synechococcus sp. RS9902]|nr:hypothetical protein SynRS9902_01444 [Synechococcus sp. RS9902]